MYLRWRRLLPEWIQIIPVELPGRGHRLGEPFAENFVQLVSQICSEHSESMQRRYALFGHSMGALLAYGVALHQHARKMPLPEIVFASGSPAPSHHNADRFMSEADDAALIADLRKLGGTPEEVFNNPELLKLVLSTLSADYRICNSFQYSPHTPLPLPLCALGGRADEISAERIEAWQHETRSRFDLTWFDGDHFFIRQQEQQVISTIQRALYYSRPS